ncbi:hypothetical protein HDU76_001844 [Blyttiomyces sp. JEL0837]|nr:hypothetical protein HDU76_001844 [Blyttiomyces sp. JEL0837]
MAQGIPISDQKYPPYMQGGGNQQYQYEGVPTYDQQQYNQQQQYGGQQQQGQYGLVPPPRRSTGGNPNEMEMGYLGVPSGQQGQQGGQGYEHPSLREFPDQDPMLSGNNFQRKRSVYRPTGNNSTLVRNRSMYRAERSVELPPLLTTSNTVKRTPAQEAALRKKKERSPWVPENPWIAFSWCMTCCCPSFCLTGMKIVGAGPQQAWREKVALCWIVFFLSLIVLFYIAFFNSLLCPPYKTAKDNVPLNVFGGILVRGNMFNAVNATPPYNTLFSDVSTTYGGIDVTTQFTQPPLPQCTAFLSQSWANLQWPCEMDNSCLDIDWLMNPQLHSNVGILPYNRTTDNLNVTSYPLFEWKDVKNRQLVVYKSSVLNFQPYLSQYPLPTGDPVDTLIRSSTILNDASHLVLSNPLHKGNQSIDCLANKYYAGQLDSLPSECLLSYVITVITSAIILGIILIRFFMAVLFAWFVSARLSRKPKPDSIREREFYAMRPSVPALRKMDSDTVSVDSFGTAGRGSGVGGGKGNLRSSYIPTAVGSYDTDLHTVLLVTCYSEGEESMRNTLESLVATDYHDEKKLLYVVCDGLITGKGESKSTPQIVLDLLELDTELGGNPKPYSYVAVAGGKKQHNMAKVYCGIYAHKGRRVPTIVVVKCGTPDEAGAAKPGNRGKRDSQLILMNFFSRVCLRDRMTPLDYDMFRKIHHITGFTPDFYEILLMVDADTLVISDSLRAMTNCMYNNPDVMGLCGETRIENKRQSWVTMIQVFEYYISHHLGKAFESMFGGVTCLPGCFCMYRIKAKKGDDWVPILVNPDIVSEYSTNEVETLHQKNLLLLGEDRFLTTLMLRTFPRRKQVFVPKALCRTVVPDDFKTLLSQRRRWINSTIHNLMELVKLRNLCGTFCFSMQFVVFMDLIGTAILPVGLALTYYLIYVAAVKTQYHQGDIATYANTITLVGVIFMPAILVMLTSRKMSYVLWMGLYLLALPIWQIILPLYAFWNFDDFSWGATRQVAGAGKDTGHGDGGDEEFDPSVVPFKRWEEYEVIWRRNIAKKRSKIMMQRSSMVSLQGGAQGSPALSGSVASGGTLLTQSQAGYHYGRPDSQQGLAAGAAGMGVGGGGGGEDGEDFELLDEVDLRR